MNFLGMGTLEVLVVLLVAFIFLGPQRMVDAARIFGKMMAEVRRMTVDLPQLLVDEGTPEPDNNPKAAGRVGSPTAQRVDGPREGDNQGNGGEGPVAFRRTGQAVQRSHTEPPAEERPVKEREE